MVIHDSTDAAIASYYLGVCGKRTYRSIGAIRRAFRRAGFRIRAYYCRDCHGLHVANHEKR